MSPPSGPANDVRIDCKAAKHSDGDRGAPVAPNTRMEMRAARRHPSADCSSAAIAARANKRRFVNLLQQLGGAVSSPNDSIVFIVASDPAPEDTVANICSECAVVKTNANRPIFTHSLEVQRRMTRIANKEPIVGFCEFLNLRWQLPKQKPEVRAGVMIQNFVLLPCRCASRASSNSRSSFPDSESRSI